MNCPKCEAPNDDSAGVCFGCGEVLDSALELEPGTVIASRYELQSQLGKGGMGRVFKAHDRILDEVVALKLLRSEVASEPEMARRFRSEIKLARRVRHKNVCGIHEYGEEGPLRFIAMELIQGVDLRKLLSGRGGLPTEEAFDVSIAVCEGLRAIHEAGIIHRDVKTSNIMRDSHGVVRLMDFGIAKEFGVEGTLGNALTAGTIAGTPEYMSPEQARGEKIDFRTDIYAAGIVLFEVFTGKVPFRGDTPLATIIKHLQEAPPLEGPAASGLPVAMVPVLQKALAKAREERYPSMQDLLDAVREARVACCGAGPLDEQGARAAAAVFLDAAQQYLDRGSLAEARAAAEEALAAHPGNAAARALRDRVSAMLASQGQAELAEEQASGAPEQAEASVSETPQVAAAPTPVVTAPPPPERESPPKPSPPPSSGGVTWVCPSCARRVPRRVGRCRCGAARPELAPTPPTTGASTPARTPTRRRPFLKWAALGWALLAAVIAERAYRTWTAPPAPASPPADVVTPSEPAAAEPPASATRVEEQEPAAPTTPTSPPIATPEPTDATEPTPAAPTPAVAPQASPSSPLAELSPEATPESRRSEVDARREAGEKAFETAVAALAQRAGQWNAYKRKCLGQPSTSARSMPGVTLLSDCSIAASEMARLVPELRRALRQAEDAARRTWVPPGTQREIRGRYGMGEGVLDRMEAEIVRMK